MIKPHTRIKLNDGRFMIRTVDGTEIYFNQNNRIDREDETKPAIIPPSGMMSWYKDGHLIKMSLPDDNSAYLSSESLNDKSEKISEEQRMLHMMVGLDSNRL